MLGYSQHPTANSHRPTANSQQPTASCHFSTQLELATRSSRFDHIPGHDTSRIDLRCGDAPCRRLWSFTRLAILFHERLSLHIPPVWVDYSRLRPSSSTTVSHEVHSLVVSKSASPQSYKFIISILLLLVVHAVGCPTWSEAVFSITKVSVPTEASAYLSWGFSHFPIRVCNHIKTNTPSHSQHLSLQSLFFLCHPFSLYQDVTIRL